MHGISKTQTFVAEQNCDFNTVCTDFTNPEVREFDVGEPITTTTDWRCGKEDWFERKHKDERLHKSPRKQREAEERAKKQRRKKAALRTKLRKLSKLTSSNGTVLTATGVESNPGPHKRRQFDKDPRQTHLLMMQQAKRAARRQADAQAGQQQLSDKLEIFERTKISLIESFKNAGMDVPEDIDRRTQELIEAQKKQDASVAYEDKDPSPAPTSTTTTSHVEPVAAPKSQVTTAREAQASSPVQQVSDAKPQKPASPTESKPENVEAPFLVQGKWVSQPYSADHTYEPRSLHLNAAFKELEILRNSVCPEKGLSRTNVQRALPEPPRTPWTLRDVLQGVRPAASVIASIIENKMPSKPTLLSHILSMFSKNLGEWLRIRSFVKSVSYRLEHIHQSDDRIVTNTTMSKIDKDYEVGTVDYLVPISSSNPFKKVCDYLFGTYTLERRRLTFVPHILSASLSELPNNANRETVEANMRQRILRMAKLPIRADESASLLAGSEFLSTELACDYPLKDFRLEPTERAGRNTRSDIGTENFLWNRLRQGALIATTFGCVSIVLHVLRIIASCRWGQFLDTHPYLSTVLTVPQLLGPIVRESVASYRALTCLIALSSASLLKIGAVII